MLTLTRSNADLEVIDGDEVWEERQDVLDLEEVTLVQELHRLLDVLVFLDHVTRCRRKQTLKLLCVLTAESIGM